MKNFSQKHLISTLAILVLILAVTSVYLYKKTVASKITPEQTAQLEAQSLALQVGKLMVLPTGELPTVATVSDPAALKDQAFFVDAKKGDKVLIYSAAKKAILYDPILNKIVNIAPLNIGDTKTVTAPKTITEVKKP